MIVLTVYRNSPLQLSLSHPLYLTRICARPNFSHNKFLRSRGKYKTKATRLKQARILWGGRGVKSLTGTATAYNMFSSTRMGSFAERDTAFRAWPKRFFYLSGCVEVNHPPPIRGLGTVRRPKFFL